MKIADSSVHLMDDADQPRVRVALTAANGVTGEAWIDSKLDSPDSVIVAGQATIGTDARAIERVRVAAESTVATDEVHSLVESAAWDLLGNLTGAPVKALLGNSGTTTRTCLTDDRLDSASSLADIETAAFHALKETPHAVRFRFSGAEGIDHLPPLMSLRGVLGMSVGIIADLSGTRDEQLAKDLANMSDRLGLLWIEEPPVDLLDSLWSPSGARLAIHAERHKPDTVMRLVRERRIAALSVDPSRMGLLGARRMSAYCATHQVAFALHGAQHVVSIAAEGLPDVTVADGAL